MKEEQLSVLAAKKNVEARERKCDVETSRNMLLLARAQQEVLDMKEEVRSFTTLKDKCEAQRKKIERLENELVAANRSAPKSKRLSLRTDSQQEIVAERVHFLISSIMDALSLHPVGMNTSINSVEPALRGHDNLSVHVSTLEECFFQAATKVLVESIGPARLVELVEAILPRSFFTRAGDFLNSSIRSFAATLPRSNDLSWSELYQDCLPESLHVFLDNIFRTTQFSRGVLSATYGKRLQCRKMAVVSSIANYLDPTFTQLLQRDMGSAIRGALPRGKLLQACSSLGMSVSQTSAATNRETRENISRKMVQVNLEVWTSICGGILNVIMAYDNLDVMLRDPIHVLLGAIFLPDPVDARNRSGISRIRFRELTDTDLVDERPEERLSI